MGPGRVTTTAEAWMATVESAQRATQGSLQLLASGVGPEVFLLCVQLKETWQGYKGFTNSP